MTNFSRSFFVDLSNNEKRRDRHDRKSDTIHYSRLKWRANIFRHLVHPMPGQSILEIGSGNRQFTEILNNVLSDSNPITAISFVKENYSINSNTKNIHCLSILSSEDLKHLNSFDFIVSIGLVELQNYKKFFQFIKLHLKPTGQLVLFESNPRYFSLQLRNLVPNLKQTRPKTKLLNRNQIHKSLLMQGFGDVITAYHDFVYTPFASKNIWLLRNLSVIFENIPFIRTTSRSIIIHATKSGQQQTVKLESLFRHQRLYRKISVVIPCYNESENLELLVNSLITLYRDYFYEIILIDDNSTDETPIIIKKLATENELIKPVFRKNSNGVGLALNAGYTAAQGQWLLSMDCDFQHLLIELQDLFDAADKGDYDVVVGSRFSRDSIILNYPASKVIANRGFHALAKILLRRRFRDLTNNLKLIRKTVVNNIKITQAGFAANAETGFLPLIMGCKIKEVPISWVNRKPGMGISTFHLTKSGPGYSKVLLHAWLSVSFKYGRYKDLPKMGTNIHTYREY